MRMFFIIFAAIICAVFALGVMDEFWLKEARLKQQCAHFVKNA